LTSYGSASPLARRPSNFNRFLTVKQFVAVDNLGVVSILDFDPSWIPILFRVQAQAMLGNDAFQVAVAGEFERSFAVPKTPRNAEWQKCQSKSHLSGSLGF